MMFRYIIEGIVGALICGFICGGWYLIGEWVDDISFRRWDKKMNEKYKEKED